VTFNRLLRQLRREATANPKRAVVLGLLAMVALWFWAPLVIGWLGGDDSEDMNARVEPVTKKATASSAAPAPAEGNKKPRPKWQDLAQWMDADRRTTAADSLPNERDPFTTRTVLQRVAVDEEPEDVPASVTPDGLGMALSSTIVGPQRRVARINGKSYRQGRMVRMTKDGRELSFLLAEVQPGKVVLSRDGEQFELKAPTPTGRSRIELMHHAD